MRRPLIPVFAACFVACHGPEKGSSDSSNGAEFEVVVRNLELREWDEQTPEPDPPAPVEGSVQEDEDAPLREAATLADGGADEVVEFSFKQCVHALEGKRPALTKATQRRTKRVLGHVTKRLRMSPGFRKLLRLVALRESSYQSGLVHRLQPDLEGSLSAWRRMSKRYEGNPHAGEAALWQTYGLFGMNSNYFTMLWDQKADPRVLCDPIVDIVVYRRAAARALRKLNGTFRCRDAKGEAYEYSTEPTWMALHRAVNGGKLCPSRREEQAAIMRKYFTVRAKRVGLDPDERVTMKMLGVEPEEGLDGEPWETQEEMVMGLWDEVAEFVEDS